MSDEKQRRVYYQGIVYDVCNLLDRLAKRRPGQGIVCGTADEPSTAVQNELSMLVEIMERRAAAADDMRESDRS